MKGFVSLLAVLATAVLPCIASAQRPRDPVRYGYVVGQAREVLEASWDATNPTQNERGMCISIGEMGRDPMSGAEHWVAREVQAPVLQARSTPVMADYECPPGQWRVHTHPPATCKRVGAFNVDPKSCVIGGNDAYACGHSASDRQAAEFYRVPSIVQCDKHSFVFYWPPNTPALEDFKRWAGESSEEQGPTFPLVISNRGFNDAVVYNISGGRRIRLGLIRGFTEEVILLPKYDIPDGRLRVLVHQIGSGDFDWASEEVPIGVGGSARLEVHEHAPLSSLAVFPGDQRRP
jgi:hypothetical protein